MMTVLKLHDTGPPVATLQQDLSRLGFTPGPVDGVFGEATEAALRAFQARAGLMADGMAGPATLAALSPSTPKAGITAPDITAHVTAPVVAKMFPLTPLAHIRANLPPVLAALRAAGLGDKAMVLMALGTIRAETAGFLPISEGVSRFNTSAGGDPFDLYDDRRDLGNQGAPDGERFRGRGFVQLTGRANYRTYGPRLGASLLGAPPPGAPGLGEGADLVEHPEMANDPTIAARLLALFLKDKEPSLRAALARGDLAAARRLVNGGAHGLPDFVQVWNTGERMLPEA